MVDFMLTSTSSESRFTGTFVSIDLIGTKAIVRTWIWIAVIDIDFTTVPTPSRVTNALVGKETIHTKAIDTRRSGTKVYLVLASFSRESRWTITLEVIHQIGAVGAKKTGFLCAVVDVAFTIPSRPSWWT